MRKDIKERIVEALRSGKYEQGKYTLKRRGRHCCLGVMCDVLKDDEEFRDLIEIRDDQIWTKTAKGELSESVKLSRALSGRIGFAPYSQKVLFRMNDTGMSFETIADWIERNL